MARRAHAYPQVTPIAADLVDQPVTTAPVGVGAADALRLARRRGAVGVACGKAGWALTEDLARAQGLGLAGIPAEALARRLPVVDAHAAEVTVRRHLRAGAAAVVVVERGTPVGAVTRGPAPLAISMQARLEQTLDVPALQVLATTARLAAAAGARAFAVGGIVRDAWLGRAADGRDLDVVVEGDGPEVARLLADALGGTLVEHERFLTASVARPGGGRVDVVTARSERYETRGALPRVMPAGIEADMRRRDFAVNAMAIELGDGGFPLLDPFGGTADLGRRRLRILHPLSFVEDPTRIFRAARYAARLELALDAWSVRCRKLALDLVPYEALSGHRLAAEIQRILAEPTAGAALVGLARAGAFRLLHPSWRATAATVARLAAGPEALVWARAHVLAAAPVALAGLAVAADQPDAVAQAALRGLALSGAPLDEALAARAGAVDRLARVRQAPRRSDVAAALRDLGPTALAWLHLVAEPAARARLDWFASAGRSVESALGGEELIALGIPPGPALAEARRALRDARLDGVADDRETAVAWVRQWVQTRTTEG